MHRAKLFMIGILTLLGMVIVLQNTEPVETKILFMTLTMPRAVLLIGTTVIGFFLGILVSFVTTKKGKKTQEKLPQEEK